MKKWILLSVLLLVVTGIAQAIPDPSAVYCILQGYEYEIRTDEQGNQYGVCVFPDGSECGAWDYYCKCEPNGIGCWPGNFTCHWPCKEMRCKEAGESVLVSKCCEGLDEIYPAHIFDANCNKLELVGWLFLCSDCGNGICESWESKCNCPEDCAQPHIIYVDADASGANNGSSWVDAYNYLQDALMMAFAEEEIRVAQGVYRPDEFVLSDRPNQGREETFQLINGVTLRGGYAGFGEPDPNARDIELYETILSGDLNGDDIEVANPEDMWLEPSRAENSYHVVTGSETNAAAILDGFTITGGNANGYPETSGGGMFNTAGDPTVTNCTFTGNWASWDGLGGGGGMANDHSNPTITNCTFSDNAASCWGGGGGGGMRNVYSNPILTNCTFSGNTAATYCGGGMWNIWSNPTLTNCIFTGNFASFRGGGMHNDYGSFRPTLANCIFVGNQARQGGGIYGCSKVNATLVNCTFSSNSAEECGGGMYNNDCDPTLANCTFKGNSAENAGGMCCHGGSPTLNDCTFIGNSAAQGQGGALKIAGSPRVINCSFVNNSALIGGAIFNMDSWATLSNCVFNSNSASWWGGAWFSVDSETVLSNCTFSGNYAPKAGGIGSDSDYSLILTNSILWGNSDSGGMDASAQIDGGGSINYCCIQGGLGGTGNIDADPLFVDSGRWVDANDPNVIVEPNDPNALWVYGDYHLKSQAGRWDENEGRWTKDEVTSPCIDAGNPSSPIGFEPFPNGGRVNMGAYGGTAEASKSYFGEPVCETIVAGDINGDCKVNFLDFRLMALHWLEER